MRQEQVQPEAELCKVVLVQLFGIIGAELVRRGHAADDGELVRVDQRPRASVRRVLGVAIESPDEGDDESVVSPPETSTPVILPVDRPDRSDVDSGGREE